MLLAKSRKRFALDVFDTAATHAVLVCLLEWVWV